MIGRSRSIEPHPADKASRCRSSFSSRARSNPSAAIRGDPGTPGGRCGSGACSLCRQECRGDTRRTGTPRSMPVSSAGCRGSGRHQRLSCPQAACGGIHMTGIQRIVEAILFHGRWLLVPFLLGLLVGLAALAGKFILKLGEFVLQIPSATPSDVLVGLLTLVDLTLTANLIVIVICSTYDNLLARI